MSWLSDVWSEAAEWWPILLTLGGLALTTSMLAWVLMTKSNSTSAVAWCLVILFLPFIGAVFFLLFGYQHINRPLQRKRRHKLRYRLPPYPPGREPGAARLTQTAKSGPAEPNVSRDRDGAASTPRELSVPQRLALLAERVGAYPLTPGNKVDFYFDGQSAFPPMLEALQAARHHVHLEFYIFHGDGIGTEFLNLLTRKAREGVEVRLLYDAMGSYGGLRARDLAELRRAGGRVSVFLPINLLRRRMQVNMRNHRKILVVDGQVGFIGGLNIGDEYMGRSQSYGYWRDAHMRIHGPGVGDLQRVFAEDWDFAAGEPLAETEQASRYFPPTEEVGDVPLQLIDSGPDRDVKSIREMYFAAILKARQRVWIASPYFIPDAGLLDALRLAGHLGIDVRLLNQFRPDKWVPQFGARYYWNEVLPAGVKIYQYARGMMHSKMILVDGDWASVGTANMDNRSLYLNFEVNCLIYSPREVARLEQAFLGDLRDSIRLDRAAFLRRPFAGRLLENACRLLSPVL